MENTIINYYRKLNKRNNMCDCADFNGFTFTKREKYLYCYAIKMKLHRYVYCYYHNLNEIPKGYVIHHIDCNTKNNEISNLQLVTKSEHIILHRKGSKASEETKRKMSISAFKRGNLPRTEKQIQQLKQLNINKIGRKRGPMSAETKKKISESEKGKKKMSKPKKKI